MVIIIVSWYNEYRKNISYSTFRDVVFNDVVFFVSYLRYTRSGKIIGDYTMEIFETVHDRKNTRSVKWDMVKDLFQSEDVLPMWVADMDFQAPDAVNQALIDRAKHGIYGYTIVDDSVKSSIVNWISKRHHWNIKSEWLS